MGKPSVMIVDDYAPDRVFSRLMLQRSGCFGEVFEVPGAEEAIELFRRWREDAKAEMPDGFPPAIILLDLNMPKMNGFDFLERFSSIVDQRYVPDVVVLTSSGEDVDRGRAGAFGLVRDYMTKPLTVDKAHELFNSHSSSS